MMVCVHSSDAILKCSPRILDGLREKMMDHDIVTAVLTMLMDKSSAPAVRHAALECTAGFVKDGKPFSQKRQIQTFTIKQR